MTTFNVTNASSLQSALTSAVGGDTINLADGSYGSVTLSGHDKNDATGLADPPAAFAPFNTNGTRNETFWTDWEADPARPEKISLVLIQGGPGAVFTTLIVDDCSGLHFKGFRVQNTTASFDAAIVRLRGCVCCIVDQLDIYGAPLASDISAHNGTGFGRGQGILCGNTSGGTAGDENHYLTIRGCYLDEVNDGIRCHGAGGQSNAGTRYWVHSNQVYQVSTDAFRCDGCQDSIFEKNLLPYHYHPTVDGGESAHNDTFQSSAQGASRVGICYNLRLPGFQGGSREANHVGHDEGSVYTMQGPFFADASYVDCVFAHNFMIIGNQNALWFGESGFSSSGCMAINNTMLRDPIITPDTDSGLNPNSVFIKFEGTHSGQTSARNVVTEGNANLGNLGARYGVGYGSWAGSNQWDNFYTLPVTTPNTSWEVALSDLAPVPGSAMDPDTNGTSTFGAYQLLDMLEANSYAWPPAVEDGSPASRTLTIVAQEAGSDTFAASLALDGATLDFVFDLTFSDRIVGTMAAQESGADTLTANAAVESAASLSAQETGTDTATMALGAVLTASLATQEAGDDTAAATLGVEATAALTAQESGSDTFSALIGNFRSLTIAAQEDGEDSASANLAVASTASVAAQEAGSDTAAFNLVAVLTASFSAQENGADAFTAALYTEDAISFTFAAQEAGSDILTMALTAPALVVTPSSRTLALPAEIRSTQA